MAHRQVAMGNYPAGITVKRASGVHWSGKVVVDYDRIKPAFDQLPKKKHKRVFVTSMADLFHKDVPDDFIEDVFAEMTRRPHLTFQVLTKRPERAALWWARWEALDASLASPTGLSWPDNVWMGTTAEDQKCMDDRAWALMQIPAAVRFLSCEPLRERVYVPYLEPQYRCRECGAYGDGDSQAFEFCAEENIEPIGNINWVIAGGESGQKARPSHPGWFRHLRDQCVNAGMPYFFKQHGAWAPMLGGDVLVGMDGRPVTDRDPGFGDVQMSRVGTRAAGNTLDGRRWLQFPQTKTAQKVHHDVDEA